MTGPIPPQQPPPPPQQPQPTIFDLLCCCFASPSQPAPVAYQQQQQQQPGAYYPGQQPPVPSYQQNQYSSYQQPPPNANAAVGIPGGQPSFFARPLFFPPATSLDPLLALINSARSTLDIAIYNITADNIANPIINAQKRGVRVRVVTDPEQARGGRGNDVDRMEQAGIQVFRVAGFKSKGQDKDGLMHNKYLVADGVTVATGSFNYTRAAMDSNAENILILTNPQLAQQYLTHFNHLTSAPHQQFQQQPFHIPPALFAHALFFPSDTAFKSLTSLLGTATHTLDIAMFNITDDNLVDCLSNLVRQKNVRVRLVTDNDQSDNSGSDAERLGKMGVSVKIVQGPGGQNGMMHHKFGVVDGRVVFTGSFNWTKAARFNNHENVVITNHMDAVAGFANEFERLWSRG